jgi:hypothetical protein
MQRVINVGGISLTLSINRRFSRSNNAQVTAFDRFRRPLPSKTHSLAQLHMNLNLQGYFTKVLADSRYCTQEYKLQFTATITQ